MIRFSRNLVLDVFDYNNHKLCTLYDNSSDMSGQAYDVVVSTSRNGWRELSFSLPSTINDEGKVEPNYRIDYIQADYRIRLIDDDGTDWFLITEPSFSHNGYAKDVSVKAGHVCQLLKTRNLGLEFSDTEGNNVGTAEELLTTILEGTGWAVGTVYSFKEKDNSTIKKRSLIAPTKTGAFKLISNMCNLFDAKPIYHGDTKTVDIIPLNPFSKPSDGGIPDVSDAKGVVELAYTTNIHNVTRTMNSENMVTKLYAYGSYGDVNHGYCGMDECVHHEHVFTTNAALQSGTTYWFSFTDESGLTVKRHFTPDCTIPSGSKVIFSMLDPASQMYVWVESSDTSVFNDVHDSYWDDIDDDMWSEITSEVSVNGKAYFVSPYQTGTELPYSDYKDLSVQNWFSYLMDFTYYHDVNLLSDNELQKIAGYQRFASACHQLIYQKSIELSSVMLELAETIGDVNFCKLNVSAAEKVSSGDLQITLNKTDDYPEGIIYRSDYDINRKEHFNWVPSPEIKTNGDPKTVGASMLYMIYNTNPVTWEKCYLKAVDDEDEPGVLTFHFSASNLPQSLAGTKYFLFGSNNINGWLGAYEINDEANTTAINSKTKTVTVGHPLKFGNSLPTIVDLPNATQPDYDLSYYSMDTYGWFWVYGETVDTNNALYFHHDDYDGTGNSAVWRLSYVQDTQPSGATEGSYWYNWKKAELHHLVSGTWTQLNTSTATKWKNIANMFGPVYKACRNHDRFYYGVSQYYTFTASSSINAGNYYMNGPYDDIYVFTLPNALSSGDTLSYNTHDSWIELVKDGTLEPITPLPSMEAGTIDKTGVLKEDTTKCRSSDFITVTPGQTYSFTGLSIAYPLTVYKYNASNEFVSKTDNLSGYDGTFVAETSVTKVKLGCGIDYRIFNSFTSFQIRNGSWKVIETKTYRYDNVNYPKGDEDPPLAAGTLIIHDENYLPLPGSITESGEKRGILPLVAKFSEKADEVYLASYQEYVDAQDTLDALILSLANGLGDMYREGYWQKNDYVDGDEDKLYEDALDTIREISQPKATYNVSYLDTYGSDTDETYGASELAANTRWPDLCVESAVHLIDNEININCWAYIDKINKCYDKPWKTQITINTDLSTLAQHTFADVMSNIADVANAVKAKESIYDRSKILNDDGTLATQRLKGAIDAARLAITGGASTWYTDERGNIVFESADHKTAMTLTGAGFAIANTKDEWGDYIWRSFGTGDGFTADEIIAGYISAELIEADSINGNKLIPGTIDGDRISAGTITGDNIAAATITGNNIVGETISGDKLIADTAFVAKLNAADIYNNESMHLYVEKRVSANLITQNSSAFNPSKAPYTNSDTTAGSSTLDGVQSYYCSGPVYMRVDFPTLTVGKKYTFSADCARPSSAQNVYFVLNGRNAKNVGSAAVNTWTRFSYTFTADADSTFIKIQTRSTQSTASSGYSLFVRRIQLEEGNTATPWNNVTLQSGDVRIDTDGVHMSGGKIIMDADSAIDINAGSEINVKSDGELNVAANGDINVNGGSINITSDGQFNVSAGEVNISSTGKFNVNAGLFNVASANEESAIQFGDPASPNFMLGNGGEVTAKRGVFDDLTVKNYTVMKTDSAGLADRVIVSTTEPAGHGIIWLQPNGTSTVDYVRRESNATNTNLTGENVTATTGNFSRQGSSSLGGSNFTYGVNFKIFNRATPFNLIYLKVQIKYKDQNDNDAYLTVYEQDYSGIIQPRINAYSYIEINTIASPTASTENITGNQNVALVITIRKNVSAETKLTIDEDFIIRCMSDSSSTKQACNVWYIP